MRWLVAETVHGPDLDNITDLEPKTSSCVIFAVQDLIDGADQSRNIMESQISKHKVSIARAVKGAWWFQCSAKPARIQ